MKQDNEEEDQYEGLKKYGEHLAHTTVFDPVGEHLTESMMQRLRKIRLSARLHNLHQLSATLDTMIL